MAGIRRVNGVVVFVAGNCVLNQVSVYLAKTLGSEVARDAQDVITTKTPSIVKRYGQTATASSIMPILALPEATCGFRPTGEWQRSTSMSTAIRTPKCTATTCIFTATGNRIGALTCTMAAVSMKLAAAKKDEGDVDPKNKNDLVKSLICHPCSHRRRFGWREFAAAYACDRNSNQ